jgi:hypothetical protein
VKLPVVRVVEREEAASVAGAIREGLMAFCCSAGLLAVIQIMNEELTVKVGPKGRHDPDRVATRNGAAPGSVVLGGRTVPLRRPRATLTGGGELQLDSYGRVLGDRSAHLDRNRADAGRSRQPPRPGRRAAGR